MSARSVARPSSARTTCMLECGQGAGGEWASCSWVSLTPDQAPQPAVQLPGWLGAVHGRPSVLTLPAVERGVHTAWDRSLRPASMFPPGWKPLP